MKHIDVLAISAHPDDVELMCAGTLIKLKRLGYKTGVVSLTAAELGTRGTPEIRKQENEKAARIMGLTANKILDIPDGRVQVNEANKMKIISQIRRLRPKIIFTPYWQTRHPDHSNSSHLVREAAFLAGLKKIDTSEPPHRPNKIIYCMEMYDFVPSFIVDVSETFEEKIKAMQAYKSQFHNEVEEQPDESATFISTPQFLQTIITNGKYWGHKIGAKYGEPFLVREPMAIDDPVKHFSAHPFAGLV